MAKTYLEKLQHPKWQKKRLSILKRDKWQCRYCNDKETMLHVHHLRYTKKEPHLEPSINLITVCEPCHKVVEYLKDKRYNDIGKLLLIYKHTNHYLCLFEYYAVYLHKEPLTHCIAIAKDTTYYLNRFYSKLDDKRLR